MGRKAQWPPPVYSRGGKDRMRVRSGGTVRDYTLGPTGSAESRAEYARILAELEVTGRRLAPRVEEATVYEVCTAHLEWSRGYHDSGQYARIVRALRPVGELYGHTRAGDFGPVALRTVTERWVGDGLCRTYCNTLRLCVVRAFRWAAGRELVPASVADALACVEPLRKGHTTAPERERVRQAERVVIEATLPHLPQVIADLVRLQLLTAMRPGEAVVLRPADLDRAWRVIDGADWWLYRLDRHKTDWRGHERRVPISPGAQALLQPYLDREPESYCFSPRDRLGYTKGGSRAPRERYSSRTYAQAIRETCDRHGVPRWAPNQLRHLVATELETSLGREDARCVLGHRSPQTTAIYAESVERAARALAELEAARRKNIER